LRDGLANSPRRQFYVRPFSANETAERLRYNVRFDQFLSGAVQTVTTHYQTLSLRTATVHNEVEGEYRHQRYG
ncbi:hypothetical protein, partial [Bradyrhizobium sp.]|uniref:hypothetical protein n=1 Tax=Bradyrhizobium sp. TaxID=376 RepID=UPI0039773C25